jgi:hypothetical protein
LRCLCGGRVFFTRVDGQRTVSHVVIDLFIVIILFVIIIIFFVIVLVVVDFGFVEDVDDGPGLGEVEAFGGGLDGEDYVAGGGLGVEMAGVVAG